MTQRVLPLHGTNFQLHSLSPAMDAAHDRLFNEAFTGVPNWLHFRKSTESFISGGPSPDDMDRYFQNVTPIWAILMNEGKYEVADGFWSEVVGAVSLAEQAVGTKVHKGQGYFFWALNSFHRKDDERGLLLTHEALVEDRRRHGVASPAWPVTPAASLIQLDPQSGNPNIASWWVADQVSEIDQALAGLGGGLKADDLRQRVFLKSPSEHVFLFVHSHAALLRLERMPAEHRDNDFVGRLLLGHFFHMAVVIENLLKPKTGVTGLFKAQAEALSKKVGGRMHEKTGPKTTRGSDINDQANADADGTLRRLLASKAKYDGVDVVPVDERICTGYVLRNLGGHQTSAPPILGEAVGALRAAMVTLLGQTMVTYYP